MLTPKCCWCQGCSIIKRNRLSRRVVIWEDMRFLLWRKNIDRIENYSVIKLGLSPQYWYHFPWFINIDRIENYSAIKLGLSLHYWYHFPTFINIDRIENYSIIKLGLSSHYWCHFPRFILSKTLIRIWFLEGNPLLWRAVIENRTFYVFFIRCPPIYYFFLTAEARSSLRDPDPIMRLAAPPWRNRWRTYFFFVV